MAHHTVGRSVYHQLADRLNKAPQGAPPSELLYKILEMLFSEREAELVSQLPLRPFSAARAARAWQVSEAEARRRLDDLAAKALLVDLELDGEPAYVLPPPMAGFFEFALMRVRADLDQRRLSELFYEYLNVEEDFVKDLFTGSETRVGQVFVHEPALSAENALHVLDHARASEVIRSATHRAVSLCFCRHKMLHLERACDAPLDICLTFNNAAASLIRHGTARSVELAEGLALLEQAYTHDLVQFGENVREQVNFICNCCGCCCEAMIAARKYGLLQPVSTTGFLPLVEQRTCKGCGRCVNRCPVEAMTLVSANDPRRPRRRRAQVDERRCLGCGICLKACPTSSLRLVHQGSRRLTPVDTMHRTVLMAIERGRLQHLIFDDQSLLHHRALAALLGVVLRLPPLQQALASQQLKSRYLERLLALVKLKMPAARASANGQRAAPGGSAGEVILVDQVGLEPAQIEEPADIYPHADHVGQHAPGPAK